MGGVAKDVQAEGVKGVRAQAQELCGEYLQCGVGSGCIRVLLNVQKKPEIQLLPTDFRVHADNKRKGDIGKINELF